jgi:AbiV family abortive infection protein
MASAGAKAVLAIGEWPSAFADAALALEEFGKAYLCVTALGMPPAIRAEFAKDFGKSFIRHDRKLAIAQLMLDMHSGDAEPSMSALLTAADKRARTINETKFRSLYVDFSDDGRLLKPSEVTEEQARGMVDTTHELLGKIEPLATEARNDPAGFVAFVRQWQSGLDLDAIAAAYEADPDGLIAQLRAVLRDEGPAPGFLTGGLEPYAVYAEPASDTNSTESPLRLPTTSVALPFELLFFQRSEKDKPATCRIRCTAASHRLSCARDSGSTQEPVQRPRSVSLRGGDGRDDAGPWLPEGAGSPC